MANEVTDEEWDIEKMYADLDTHHIEGYAHQDVEQRHFDMPLISEVLPNLWQGGCKMGVKLPADFDYVVSLYPWEKYALGPKTSRTEITAYDSAEVPDVSEAVDLVYDAWKRGEKVLIHCQAGLNRSGFTAAQVLMKDGYSAKDAIQLLRDNRSPVVLCNQAFENHLLEMDKATDEV